MAVDPGVYRQVVESSPDGLWFVDAEGCTVFANARAAELLGRTEEELGRLCFADLLDEPDRFRFLADPATFIDPGRDRRSVTWRFRAPDGTVRPLLVKEQVFRDDRHAVSGCLFRLTDDAGRRALVESLRRSESQLAEAQAIARIGSWEYDVNRHQATWSPELFALLGVDAETYVPGPANFLAAIVDADRDMVEREWNRLTRDVDRIDLETRVRRPDGSVRWVRMLARVVERDKDGKAARVGGTMQDIDDLKRTELHLRNAVEANALMQFMATAANETGTLTEALVRLRDLLLVDPHWLRGVAFDVVDGAPEWRRLEAEEPPPTESERQVAARALANPTGFVLDEEVEPDRLLVGFPVTVKGVRTTVAVITALTDLRHRPVLHTLVAQVAGQLAQVAAREELVLELTRSRSQLADAQAIARLGSWEMWVDDPDHATCSAELYRVLDVDPAEWEPGLNAFLDCLIEEDRAPVLEVYAQALCDDVEHVVDARVVMRDGTPRWVRAMGQVLERDADGAPRRMTGTMQVIQEMKESEQRLLDAVELNTTMQSLATAANQTSTLDEVLVSMREVLLHHPDWHRGVAFDVTETGLQHRPITADDVAPMPIEIQVAQRVLDVHDVVFEEVAVPQRPLVGIPVDVDGRTVLVVVVTNVSPFRRHAMVRSLAGQVAGELAQVASREAAAAQLATARDLAMAASNAKSDFLATMSHEIRTPLNGVIGLNELLLRTELDPQQRQLAEAMQGAGRTLLVLISDILDFSKIEAGGLELEDVPFRPAVVVQGALELFEPMAVAKGIKLRAEIDPSVPERLEGDPSRWGQVLSNLVANAVKFTTDGAVDIRVSAATVGRDATLRVVVRDSGIGMDAAQQSRIFQPFRQADASTTRNFGGTGLGLAIAHRLATALGGEIGFDSVPGEGSTFWFTGRFQVPVAPDRPAVREAPTAAQAGGGGHVLVVEDNEVNQLVAVGMLEALGFTTEVAADGAAAAARAAGGRFDAVLMDLQMPRLDGYAATRLIRRAEAPGVHVPIIALTASVTSGEQERCLAAGMTGFLSKPVGLEALAKVLREQLPGGLVAEPVSPRPDPDRRPLVAMAGRPGHPEPCTPPTLDTGRLDELAEMGAAAFPLIQRAIDNFVGGIAPNLDELRADAGRSDAPSLRSHAHRLKGSAANLGALRVAELARQLEQAGADEQLDAADDLIACLASALAEVATELALYRLEEPGEEASA
ncbi:MAG TPA: PAS domain-containing protein [Marmoricola sp.]|nr:PAS domain-containing protein [Marmoricola sp.]